MTTRRTALRILGGGVIVAAAAGAGLTGFAMTRSPTRALAPWKAATEPHETPIRHALSHAILAPNPHNRQSWVVDITSGTDAVLYHDTDRELPETDPFDRQLTIGLGCFLELCAIAASDNGYAAEIEAFPDGFDDESLDTRPIARIQLTPRDQTADPLAEQITARRTYKDPFDRARTISRDTADQVLAASDSRAVRTWFILDDASVRSLRDLTWQAWMVEAETERTYLESVDLMRIGKDEIEASPDGIDLGGPFLEALHLAGVLTREKLADPTSQAYAEGVSRYRDIIGTAMGYIAIATPGNSRLDQINAGRAFVRQQLQATALGLAVHPLSQALQEYPEMAQTRAAVDAALGVTAPERLQMLSRIGYPPASESPQPPSPRWPLDRRLKDT